MENVVSGLHVHILEHARGIPPLSSLITSLKDNISFQAFAVLKYGYLDFSVNRGHILIKVRVTKGY